MNMDEIAPRISVDPKVMFGKQVVKGTRVPVDIVLGQLASGMSFDEVGKEYGIEPEDILTVLSYGRRNQ